MKEQHYPVTKNTTNLAYANLIFAVAQKTFTIPHFLPVFSHFPRSVGK